MAPVHSQETRNKAKVYWESGMSPQSVREALVLNDGVTVPLRTISHWARTEGWNSWKDAQLNKLATVNPNVPFGVTNIQDPVLHLATQQAKNLLYQMLNESNINEESNKTGLESPSSLIRQCLAEVEHTYAIGVRGIEYLRRSVLPAYIRELRKIRDKERNTRQEDRPAKILSWTDIPPEVEQMITRPLSANSDLDFVDMEGSNYGVVWNDAFYNHAEIVTGDTLSQGAVTVEQRLELLEQQIDYLIAVIKGLTGEDPQTNTPLDDESDQVQPFQAIGEMHYNEDGDFVPVPLSEEMREAIDRLREEDKQTEWDLPIDEGENE